MTLRRLQLCANWINQEYSDYSLLDAGCRTMDLKPLLNGNREYFGTDLFPGEGVMVCNLEEKLPFGDEQFDIVTALDVLEHLNDPHTALQELIRVAKKAIFVSLPNMYYIQFRWNYLRGNLSGKYAFPKDPVLDRHRWVMSYQETLDFIYHNAANYTVSHQMILPLRGRTRLIAEPVEKFLGENSPNLFAYGALFKIKLEKTA